MVVYDLKDVATVSGKPGLFLVVKPTRNGVIIETMDDSKRRMMIQTRHKISLLQEISIFTTDEDGSIPLDQVFSAIHENYGTEVAVDQDSNDDDLRDFIQEVVANYDEERVYTSDVKKLLSWYSIVNTHLPPVEKKEEKKEKAKPKAKAKKTPAKKEPKKESEAKPAAAKAKKAKPAAKKK